MSYDSRFRIDLPTLDLALLKYTNANSFSASLEELVPNLPAIRKAEDDI